MTTILERTRSYGLDRLQVCENVQPWELSGQEWRNHIRQASEIGLEIQLGCKTLSLDVLRKHLERAADTASKMLRIVLEEDADHPPSRSVLSCFLEAAAIELEKAGVRLAIENYFAIPSKLLAEVVMPYPSSRVGFCVDSANSLRNFEPPEYVLKHLGARAFCYHLKDFNVRGDNVGFAVMGSPLGRGDLELDRFLDVVFATHKSPQIFLENWVPSTRDWESDVEADDLWLRESLANLRERLKARGM